MPRRTPGRESFGESGCTVGALNRFFLQSQRNRGKRETRGGRRYKAVRGKEGDRRTRKGGWYPGEKDRTKGKVSRKGKEKESMGPPLEKKFLSKGNAEGKTGAE